MRITHKAPLKKNIKGVNYTIGTRIVIESFEQEALRLIEAKELIDILLGFEPSKDGLMI